MHAASDAASLSADLHSLLLRQLQEEWHTVNQLHFAGVLKAPQLALQDSAQFLGRWTSNSRSITLAMSLVLEQPWSVVREVLRHEVAHQYVDEVLHAKGETAHGPAFQHVCRRLGIDPTASGMPRAVGPSEEEERVLRRVARLLALAESPNEHEAQAATQQAQKLMLKYNIDLQKMNKRQDYHFRQVGQPRGRHDSWEQVLGGLLTQHFFVEGIWVHVYLPKEGRKATVLEISGTQANLEIATYVYDFMVHAAELAWRRFKQERKLPGDKERRRFLVGVMIGYRQKLASQEVQNRQEGLILAKDAALEDYFDRRHPRTVSRRNGSTAMTEAFQEGMEAGKKLVLHKGVQENAGNRGRLLG